MKIGKRFSFEAAHDLPNHDGKCRGLHGHSYQVEVVVQGERRPVGEGLPDEGMVIDFKHVSEAFKTYVFQELDHKYLNDVLAPMVTTAENLAAWIHREMETALTDERISVVGVTVWETATSWASTEGLHPFDREVMV